MKRYPPVSKKCPHMLHGGDYNPDQWKETPAIWDEDMRLMRLAGCNAMSVGIFSWAALEPEEGKYEFGWLDTIMEKLEKNDSYCILATPSGSKPAWMSHQYPEVCRMAENGIRERHCGRHNHCRTSPVYREKCVGINTMLAERYKDHPALILWHVSNEYNGGPCYCEHCLGAFRDWLKKKFDNDLDKLNHAYWTGFWSHALTDWSQVYPNDHSVHGMMLDWRRFITAQTIDFFLNECKPLKAITPDIPVTANFMGLSDTLDYPAFAKVVDVVSWDSYPAWHHHEDDVGTAMYAAFVHDQNRSMREGQPFLLMESVPSVPSRPHASSRKRPGMHLLSSLQAVAHGADSVQYFQWRKGRGGSEKFHGAVIDHVGHERTRVFRDVADVGNALKRLDNAVGAATPAEVAVVFDWENRWAMTAAFHIGQLADYEGTAIAHYATFRENGVAVDVIDQTLPLEKYKLVILPMGYLLRPGFAGKIAAFVERGGTAVATYYTGIVDENDLCFLGGTPGGGLMDVFGIWEEELDMLHGYQTNAVLMNDGNALGLSGRFEAKDLCAVIHPRGAEVLGVYESDFYAGLPALTANSYGQGEAYYMAARLDNDDLRPFYRALIEKLGLARALGQELPHGVTVQKRVTEEAEYFFLQNYNKEPARVALGEISGTDLLSESVLAESTVLAGYGVAVLERKR